MNKERFVLKGAMLYLAWGGETYRPARDLDLLGFGDPEVSDLKARIAKICSVRAADGIVFDSGVIEAERIREDVEYEGVRVWVPASLEGARVTIQIDVGFGDDVGPASDEVALSTLLPLDPPVVRAYPIEVVIGEKLLAMVKLGIANSRMKDSFNLWTFANTRRFELRQLARAIWATFQRRRTPLPVTPPTAHTDEFLLDPAKRTQRGPSAGEPGYAKRLLSKSLTSKSTSSSCRLLSLPEIHQTRSWSGRRPDVGARLRFEPERACGSKRGWADTHFVAELTRTRSRRGQRWQSHRGITATKH